MNAQRSLFDESRRQLEGAFASVPGASQSLSRRTDPPTSKEAAATHVRTGRADAHCRIVLAAVQAHPGLTYNELADTCGLDAVEIMRRLNDLSRRELVRKGSVRPSLVNGNRMTTWYAT